MKIAILQDLLNKSFLGNRVLDYATCVALLLGGFVALKAFQSIFLRRLKEWAERTHTTLDDFLIGITRRIALPLMYFGVFYLAIGSLALHAQVKRTLVIAGMAVLTLSAVRLAIVFIDFGFKTYFRKSGKNEALEHSFLGIFRMARFLVWALAVIFFLDNLGFKVSAVIAGLGIGGVAVALAAQAILGDLFSYFAILFDRPFEIGDFIIVEDYMGTVEHVGIKTTRISSLSGEQLVFANADLTGSRLRNYKKMKQRRVVFKLGVTYQTPLEKLRAIPEIIENVIKAVEKTVFDRAHFFSYGDFSLIFEIVYYVQSSDYNRYMDIQQEINFAIYREFQDRGIEFAYPTQTLLIASEPIRIVRNEECSAGVPPALE